MKPDAPDLWDPCGKTFKHHSDHTTESVPKAVTSKAPGGRIGASRMESGVRQWAVDIREWEATDEEFAFCLSLLPKEETLAVNR